MNSQYMIEMLIREHAHAVGCRSRYGETQSLGHYYDGQVHILARLIAQVRAANRNREEAEQCTQSK